MHKLEPTESLNIFGVRPVDPGFLYLIQNGQKYKIGRSKSRMSRLKEAKTWLPDMKVIGVKPFWNHAEKEKCLHVGLAQCWYEGEWFELHDEGFEDALIPEFRAFSDTDINGNSINFIYWLNGSGMTELLIEKNSRKQSIKRFQTNNAIASKS